MRKLLCALLAVILTLTLIGCAQIVETETKVVEATIVDIDRDPIRRVGNVTMPADYDIFLKYEDIETWIDITRSEYDEYKDLVGTTIEVYFIVNHYDDNTVKQYLKMIRG